MWNETFLHADFGELGRAEGLPSLRLVKTVGGQMEALILKARLEAERIPVHLSYESTGPLYGFRLTDLGQVHIMVPEAFEAAARSICGAAGGSAPGGRDDPAGRAA